MNHEINSGKQRLMSLKLMWVSVMLEDGNNEPLAFEYTRKNTSPKK